MPDTLDIINAQRNQKSARRIQKGKYQLKEEIVKVVRQ